MATPEEILEMANRLRLVREALGLNRRQFIAPTMIKETTYSQAESGIQRLGIDAHIELCKAYKLSLDFFYFGDKSRMPHYLVEAMKLAS